MSTSTSLGVFQESIDGAAAMSTSGSASLLEILIPGLILFGLVLWSLWGFTKDHNDD